ncbi:MAG: PKD domain-containing protein [Geodermatophilaceae bacterium]
MTADSEQLLREAMREAACQALDDRREVPPFPGAGQPARWRPTRSRGIHRFGPLTVAAAVLTIVAGATVGVAVVNANRGDDPATGTSPTAGTSPAPAPDGPNLALEIGYPVDPPVVGVETTFAVRGTGMSAEADGSIDAPVVSFGDGSPDSGPASVDNACSGDPVPIDDTFPVSHTYTQPGTYEVSASIESCGLIQTQSLTVEVSAGPAGLGLALDVSSAPEPSVAGTETTITVRGTGMTAEADGHIDYPQVSFGDGSPDAGPASIDNACSGDPVPIDDTFPVSHTYTQPGTYQVSVTIESCGLSRTQTLTVEVRAP